MSQSKSWVHYLLLVSFLFVSLSLQHGEIHEDDEDEEISETSASQDDAEDDTDNDIEKDYVLKPPPILQDPSLAGGYVLLAPDHVPGEQGTPVKIENPTPEQKALIDRGYERNAYNEYASDMISVHRSLPDYRNDW